MDLALVISDVSSALDVQGFLATIWLLVLLIWISLCDATHLRIPNSANLLLALSGLLVATYAAGAAPVPHILGALVGFGLFGLIGAVYFRRSGTDGLGLGDAKFLGAAGAWLGVAALPSLVAVASVSALIYALVFRRRRLAFGPWLSASLLVHWLFSLR